MKTFEEKWTAWLDDQLTGDELTKFEASLPDKTAAQAEKNAAHQLTVLLKRELVAPALTNEEFFGHQLRQRIMRETAEPSQREAGSVSPWWTIRRLFLTGATSMAIFIVCAVFVMKDREEASEPSLSLSRVLNAQINPAAGPDASITMFDTKDEKVTVLWTEGLKSLPSDYAAK
jgi:hypothetical protein